MSWNEFKKKIKAKRTGKNGSNVAGSNILQTGEMVVQRLSAEVAGKAQKYTRVGAREFVPYKFPDITLENIKASCLKHFQPFLGNCKLECDILAGEQGPSCKTMEHIPDMKVIHVRFVKPSIAEGDGKKVDSLSSMPLPPRLFKKYKVNTDRLNTASNAYLQSVPSTSTSLLDIPEGVLKKKRKYQSMSIVPNPKSLTVTEMLKLGKIVTSTSGTAIQLFQFNLQQMSWLAASIDVQVNIEEQPFGTGGFRNAYKATCLTPGFPKQWVIKKYLEDAKKSIATLGMTLEEHNKKVVQMHLLAKNFCEQLQKKVQDSGDNNYGRFLKYNQIYYGKLESGECITLEEFIEGKFTKYMNNTGKLCVGPMNEVGQKAENLAHFSYEKSDQKLMITDIQGSGYTLFDPEIASADVLDGDANILFCAGNLTSFAINEFKANHVCNEYCRMARLSKICSVPNESK